jgi:transcriptional regulator with XRE-family HTH domain
MRISKKKHPLAVLRTLLGLGQKELAQKVGCSMDTIGSIELKRLPLSENLAARIADQTNVDPTWLLKGDPKAPPRNFEKEPYDRLDYASAQSWAAKQQKNDKWRNFMMVERVDGYQRRIKTLIAKASKKARWEVVIWQIDNALTQIENLYGIYNEK